MSAYSGSFNGFVFGPGTNAQITQITGLSGFTTRSADTPRPRQYGSFPGVTVLAERVVTISFSVFASQGQSNADTLAQMAAAFINTVDPSGLLPFTFSLPGWVTPRQMLGRVTHADVPVDVDYATGYAKPVVELTFPDPLIYDSVTTTVGPVGLPSPTAGLTFPVTFPVSFGASTGGSMTLPNLGNETAWPVFTISGPMTNPRITMPDGSLFGLTISLAATDRVTVSMHDHTVILNGTASRLNDLVTGSTWLGVPPGSLTVSVGSSDASQVTGTFTASYASAWGWA